MANSFDFEILKEAFPDASLYCGELTGNFRFLSVDSRAVKADDGFVAVRGLKLDGRAYIESAVTNGAKLIFCEKDELDESNLKICIEQNITTILINDLYSKLSALGAVVFQNEKQRLSIVGVTGTNGKSSTVQMLAQALHLLEGCCWTLGTLGVGPFGTQKQNENTTADAITIQQELFKARTAGCSNVAMEVSSHGLVQKRVDSVPFEFAIFTNLSRDHLDYHGTMEDYFAAKRELFLFKALQHAIINIDDKYGKKLKKDREIKAQKWFISLQEPLEGADLSQWVWIDNVRLTLSGIHATVYSPWGKGQLSVAIVGRFNLYNLLSVITVLGIRLKNIDAVLQVVNQLHSVTGRMQLLSKESCPLVIVDYAHSPDALEQALRATREHCSGKVFTVFGCGGDRDPGKRQLMARVAEKLSNQVIFTDDNPRTEEPTSIIEDMREGLKKPDAVKYIASRESAIRFAIEKASEKDVVLIAGKGHESYQVIGNKKLEFSDVKVAESVMTEFAA
ncbi:MAG: UDP-N-acetylmuramoyl-L-alanyl-D-glutamate--2,6-diaminopimelate ligase [Gammaproteobacteria bacterium]|nr:UDP-N-acetylmuramoyl-L-alanyl-D-glutamate--2,6-diaminopimelate ligase [Gammaproteobacteria bacterium]